MNRTELLPDEQMRELGFTDRVPTKWYLCRRVGPGVTFNVTVVKDTGLWDEVVLDEDFGQPAYYGIMREPYRTSIRDAVDAIVDELGAAGIRVAVNHRQYRY